MSNSQENIVKEAFSPTLYGLKDFWSNLTSFSKPAMMRGSPSYRASLLILEKQDAVIRAGIAAQEKLVSGFWNKKNLQRSKTKMDLAQFAANTKTFLDIQTAMVSVASPANKEALQKLISCIPFELYKRSKPEALRGFNPQTAAREVITSINQANNALKGSMRGAVLDPSQKLEDWRDVARARLAKVKAESTKPSMPQKKSDVAEEINALIKSSGIFDKWLGSRHFRQLETGRNLDEAMERMVQAAEDVFRSNEQEYEEIHQAFSKGDPTKYLEGIEQMRDVSSDAALNIIQDWDKHFEPLIQQSVAQESQPEGEANVMEQKPEGEADVVEHIAPPDIPDLEPDISETEKPVSINESEVGKPTEETETKVEEPKAEPEDKPAQKELVEEEPQPVASEPAQQTVEPPPVPKTTPQPQARKRKTAPKPRKSEPKAATGSTMVDFMERITKLAEDSDPCFVAMEILKFAEEVDTYDPDLANRLTAIAEEALDE